MKYARIEARREELLKQFDNMSLNSRTKEEGTLLLMEMESIDNFFECETYVMYEHIAQFCKENGIKRVFDIGCAYGFQSEVFLDEGLDYVGINDFQAEFWNQDRFTYMTQRYPFEIKATDTDLAISVLCLTWLHRDNEDFRAQLEALQRDFQHCVLYPRKDKIGSVMPYFKFTNTVNEDLIYFGS